MFQIKTGEIISPIVKTSDYGGLSIEDLTELCVNRIIGVSETAPPEIREQAKYFRGALQRIISEYLVRAKQSEKANCIQICVKGGEIEAANLLRRT